MKITRPLQKEHFRLLLYSVVFLYLIFQPAIYTPDSSSYFNASIIRSPGYAFFARVLKLTMAGGFDLVIVALQVLIAVFSIEVFFRKLLSVIKLHSILEFAIVLMLCLPLFAPLYTANNICSEGLSYPFYLLFLAFSIGFLFSNRLKYFYLLLATSIALALTRSQFIATPLIVAGVFILKNRQSIFKFKNLKYAVLLIGLPVVITFIDRTYHYLKDGEFVATPFSYISLNGATLYISKQSDLDDIKDRDAKIIFEDCYAFLLENNWLVTQQSTNDWDKLYKHFHNNLGNICNYTLHDRARAYYYKKGLSIVDAHISAEKSAKIIFNTLLKNNYKEWLLLFYQNLINIFKHPIVLIVFIIIYTVSLIKLLKVNNNHWTMVFFLSSLVFSNAIIVAIGSHSILRYIFYNYLLMFIIAVICIKKLISFGKTY